MFVNYILYQFNIPNKAEKRLHSMIKDCVSSEQGSAPGQAARPSNFSDRVFKFLILKKFLSLKITNAQKILNNNIFQPKG